MARAGRLIARRASERRVAWGREVPRVQSLAPAPLPRESHDRQLPVPPPLMTTYRLRLSAKCGGRRSDFLRGSLLDVRENLRACRNRVRGSRYNSRRFRRSLPTSAGRDSQKQWHGPEMPTHQITHLARPLLALEAGRGRRLWPGILTMVTVRRSLYQQPSAHPHHDSARTPSTARAVRICKASRVFRTNR